MNNPTDLLSPKAAAGYYTREGITRGRSVQTLARMRSGQSKFTGPEYVRTDEGFVLYKRDSVEVDIARIKGLPAFTSVAHEKAAGCSVPNEARDYSPA